MWNPFAANPAASQEIAAGELQPELASPRTRQQEAIGKMIKQEKAKEDIKVWLNVEEYLKTDDEYILYFRKVTGVVATQMALTLGIEFLEVKSGIIEGIFETWMVQLVGVAFFGVSLYLLLTRPHARKQEPQNIKIWFFFVIGLALFLVYQLSNWGLLESMLLLTALAMGTFSVWAGSMVSKNVEELDLYVKYATAAGAGSLLLILPIYLDLWYGDDFKFGWVITTAILSVIFSLYLYYDVVVYHNPQLFEERDYIMAALYVYIDFLWLIYEKAIKPALIYFGHMAAEEYRAQVDEPAASQVNQA